MSILDHLSKQDDSYFINYGAYEIISKYKEKVKNLKGNLSFLEENTYNSLLKKETKKKEVPKSEVPKNEVKGKSSYSFSPTFKP